VTRQAIDIQPAVEVTHAPGAPGETRCGRPATKPTVAVGATCRYCVRREQIAAVEPRIEQAIRDGLTTAEIRARWSHLRLTGSDIARLRERVGIDGNRARWMHGQEIRAAAARYLARNGYDRGVRR
jgi:hypothetical protein